MSWMFPSISLIVCSTTILTILYYYLYYIEKRAFLGIWALSWTMYLIAQIGTLFSISGVNSYFLMVFNNILFISSLLFLLLGAYNFMNKQMPWKWFVAFSILAISWFMYATNLHKTLIVSTVPISIVIGLSTIWIGIIFLKYQEGQIHLRRILGGVLIIWGIHKLDYPFLRNSIWFAPWGYTISACMSLIITMVLIIMYFEKIRNDQISAQKKVSASEKRMVAIIENQRDIILELDNEGNIIYISPACIGITGYSPEELLGKSFIDFIDASLWMSIKNSKSKGICLEKTWTKKDHTTLHTNIYCKPNFNENGMFSGVFGSIHDMTDNKLLGEAKEYDKLKTEFFANISHELRTPLNIISASIQLLELYSKNNPIIEFIDKFDKSNKVIKQNIFRLSRLINNLIDITKVDAGFFELQLNNKNIINVIEEATLSVVEYSNSNGISIQFDTDIEEKIVACDVDIIERIMFNLLSNAIKFTNAGGSIVVKVSDGVTNITISVKDTGIGIPNNKQAMIFERFRQVDKSLSRNKEGSGIGLSLVKSLVELQGGKIEVKSVYGTGSEFIITLPVTKLGEALVDSKFQNCEVKKII